jgi:protein-S-isoprenylcysteine O-methyltransferase Ste14
MRGTQKAIYSQGDLLMWLIPFVLLFGLFTGSAWTEDHFLAELAEIAGLFVAFLAMIGRAWTYLFLENPDKHIPVIQGPFRFVAYPLHFFASLAMGGLGLMMGSYLAGIFLFFIGYLISRIFINHNEKIERKHMSDEQSLYETLVPNFFPSFSARITSDGQIDQPTYSARTLKLIAFDLMIFFALVLAAELFDILHEEGTISQWFLLF